MDKVVIDSEIVSEVKIGGDWYSIKHGSLHIGELSWTRAGETQVDSGQLGFTFEIYGSQGLVVAGPLTAITGVRYSKPI
ncbi:MAG: hypothetical protein ACLFRV_01775 [Acidimicrobiales bacterium]